MTSALMKGKSYNQGARTHKLFMDALNRLMWSAFDQSLFVEIKAKAASQSMTFFLLGTILYLYG